MATQLKKEVKEKRVKKKAAAGEVKKKEVEKKVKEKQLQPAAPALGKPLATSEARSSERRPEKGRAAPKEASLSPEARLATGGAPKGRERYFEAVGRRKTAVARVRLFTKAGDFLVNDKLYTQYFPTLELQKTVEDSLQKMKLFGKFKVTVKVSGGGIHSQAEALRHGLARSLIKFNPDFRKRLKRVGFLRRDPRAKERKKFGLKKARRAPQWAKR